MKAEAPSNSLNMHSLLRRQSFKAGSMPVAGFPGSQAASRGRYTKQFPVADRLMEESDELSSQHSRLALGLETLVDDRLPSRSAPLYLHTLRPLP